MLRGIAVVGAARMFSRPPQTGFKSQIMATERSGHFFGEKDVRQRPAVAFQNMLYTPPPGIWLRDCASKS